MKVKYILTFTAVSIVLVLGFCSFFAFGNLTASADSVYVPEKVNPTIKFNSNYVEYYKVNKGVEIVDLTGSTSYEPHAIPADESEVDLSGSFFTTSFRVDYSSFENVSCSKFGWGTYASNTTYLMFYLADGLDLNPSSLNYYVVYEPDLAVSDTEGDYSLIIDKDFTGFYFFDNENFNSPADASALIPFKEYLTKNNYSIEYDKFFSYVYAIEFWLRFESSDGSDVIYLAPCSFYVGSLYNKGYDQGVSDVTKELSYTSLLSLDITNVLSTDIAGTNLDNTFYGVVTTYESSIASGLLVTGPNTVTKTTACVLPLGRVYPKDSKFKLTGKFLTKTDYEKPAFCWIMINYGNSYIRVASFSGTADIEFTLPQGASALYICSAGTVDFIVSNATLLYFTANNYDLGYKDGYNQGNTDGINNSISIVNRDSASWLYGFNAGYKSGVATAKDGSFSSLFGSIADSQVSILNSLLDFEFLGFNMASFVKAILTIFLIVAIIRLVV